MTMAAGHGGNFPHKFYRCASCGQKTVYIQHSGSISVMLRCKSCKREKFIPKEQYMNDELELALFHIDLNPEERSEEARIAAGWSDLEGIKITVEK